MHLERRNKLFPGNILFTLYYFNFQLIIVGFQDEITEKKKGRKTERKKDREKERKKGRKEGRKEGKKKGRKKKRRTLECRMQEWKKKRPLSYSS